MTKKPLYCECGGLIKLKSKEKQQKQMFKSLYIKGIMQYVPYTTKSISIYTCSKCGKRY